MRLNVETFNHKAVPSISVTCTFGALTNIQFTWTSLHLRI